MVFCNSGFLVYSHTMQKKNYTPQIDAELDLHGHTSYEAEDAVEEFLRDGSEEGWKRVRIIVGKGTHSPNNQAVLPDTVKSLLNKLGYTYTYAKLQDGGEGALEVIL